MKWVLFCMLLLLPLVSAHTSFELADVYSPEHTLVMALPDTIVGELDANNVVLYRDEHVEVPWEYGVAVRGAERYIWGVTPATMGNYSIVIRDALVIRAGIPTVEDVSFSFIIRGNSSLYSFTPGVIDLNSSSLITVTSRADTKRTLPVESKGTNTITLLPGKNVINLTKLSIGFGEHFVMGEYDVPVLGSKEGSSTSVPALFSLSSGDLRFHGALGSVQEWNITVTNEEEKKQKITLLYNKSVVRVTPDSLTLDAGESEEVDIVLAQPLRSSFTSVILFTSGNYSYPVTISVIVQSALNDSLRERNYTALLCPEVPGFICRGAETCAGESVSVSGLQSGEVCCSVACTVSEEQTSWLPWLLFLGACVLAGGAYYYYRTKKHPDQFQEDLKHAEKKVHP